MSDSSHNVGMTDNRIPVDLAGIPEDDGPRILRQCYLTLLNAGGEDGDWWEILSEINSGRAMEDVLPEYFTFIDPSTRERV